MKKKILFVLSGNLSTTPRAIKNIQLAKQDYYVDIIKVNRKPLWNNLDIKLIEELDVKPFTVSIDKKPFINWFKTNLIFLLCKVLAPLKNKSLELQSFLIHKIYLQIWLALKNVRNDYVLVIGQGSGTLFPVYNYAKKNNIPFGLDIEDYHPGEFNNPIKVKEMEFLLKKILPYAFYISYASPLIGVHTLALLSNPHPKHFLLNNSFPKNEFIEPIWQPKKEKLKFVWFSQNISYGRGLEQIIEAIKPLKKGIELHLIGNQDSNFKREWIDPNIDFVVTNKPISQQDLHKRLSEFDIGLAIELNTSNFNRQICLTNKIFAYAQAGLYILATNTLAQQKFLKENSWCGQLCGQSTEEMQNVILDILKQQHNITEKAKQRYLMAKELAWEKEIQKIKLTWNTLYTTSSNK